MKVISGSLKPKGHIIL